MEPILALDRAEPVQRASCSVPPRLPKSEERRPASLAALLAGAGLVSHYARHRGLRAVGVGLPLPSWRGRASSESSRARRRARSPTRHPIPTPFLLQLSSGSSAGREGTALRVLRLLQALFIHLSLSVRKVVGIDLGTSNSVVAAVEAATPAIIPNAEGERTTPSVVAYSQDGEILVGTTAKRQAALNPLNTFASVKRWFGRDYAEVAEAAAAIPYHLTDADGKVRLDCPALGRDLAPEEVSAQVLRKLRSDAEAFLKTNIRKAVITVPAYFDDSQRQATKTAGKLAGLDVMRICNEPTMAALAYGLDQKNSSYLLVFDLGGGTFDVSVMEAGDGICEVLATNGNTQLGGDDFDRRITSWLLENFEKETGLDLRSDKQALQRLAEASEKAKIELSSLNEVRISVPFISADDTGPKHIEEVLQREQFEDLCGDLLQSLEKPVRQALQDSRIKPKNLHEVILVGGSTRIPAVQNLAKELSSFKPMNISISPDEVVGIGAAIQAAMIAGEVKDIMLIDVTPLTLGVETDGGVFSPVMERGTAVPWKATRVFTTSADAQDAIEVVVLQGERPLAKDNKKLGTFRLDGIPTAPKGVPKIEVSFDIDVEGILTVAAKDWGTRQQQSIKIQDSSTLGDEEVQRILDDAEDKEFDDEEAKFRLELRYSAANLLEQTEQNLLELGYKAPTDARITLQPKLEAVKEALKDDAECDYVQLKDAVDVLRFELMKLGLRVYGKQVAPGGTAGPARPRREGGVAGGGYVFQEEDPDMPGNEEEEARKWAQKRKEAAARVRPRPLDEDD
ncbi:Chaperone protein dnaK [Symbiodinium microadriaticum]|uniref:Chaperone protein dnaK n=1 Tax=Symbiodinium microadriaticum TaxID=2951 RepID=A0A1Q9CE75_SYMMI|nr:Chaperone protein dnaK [Symbiodinium microadriaticum]CAE7949486.1 HSP70 [Symbiodinium sp. KB8]